MIKPTIGRQVWFWRRPKARQEPNEQPQAATVCYVWNDRMVNLSVIDHNGGITPVTSVPLRQPEDNEPEGLHCEWMPFQVGQAKAAEAEPNKAPLKP